MVESGLKTQFGLYVYVNCLFIYLLQGMLLNIELLDNYTSYLIT